MKLLHKLLALALTCAMVLTMLTGCFLFDDPNSNSTSTSTSSSTSNSNGTSNSTSDSTSTSTSTSTSSSSSSSTSDSSSNSTDDENTASYQTYTKYNATILKKLNAARSAVGNASVTEDVRLNVLAIEMLDEYAKYVAAYQDKDQDAMRTSLAALKALYSDAKDEITFADGASGVLVYWGGGLEPYSFDFTEENANLDSSMGNILRGEGAAKYSYTRVGMACKYITVKNTKNNNKEQTVRCYMIICGNVS